MTGKSNTARTSAERREAIKALIRTREINTQSELGELLAAQGFEVNQATVSRDLAQLGAIRVSRSDGGSYYGLDVLQVAPESEALRAYGAMVFSFTDTDALVVLHTEPGAASAVARAIDLVRLDEVAGTIAGDDTIFVAPTRGVGSKILTKRLKLLLGKDA
jgi:transcriptional regulator of arginine metabolism